MLVKDKVFGISTKNLEVVELVRALRKESEYDIKQKDNSYATFNPPIYILARNKNGKYKDIFTNYKYDSVDNDDSKGNIMGKSILDKVSFHKRIKYKDADKYIKEMNDFVYKKKK